MPSCREPSAWPAAYGPRAPIKLALPGDAAEIFGDAEIIGCAEIVCARAENIMRSPARRHRASFRLPRPPRFARAARQIYQASKRRARARNCFCCLSSGKGVLAEGADTMSRWSRMPDSQISGSRLQTVSASRCERRRALGSSAVSAACSISKILPS